MHLRRGSWLHATALLAVAAWVVHEGRYALAFGDRADRELAAQGHAYLRIVGPLLVWLLVAVAARFVVDVARREAPRGRPWAFGRLWAASSGVLVAVFSLQELAEGWLAAGHPFGVAAVLAAGGWWAIVLAIAAGALVALLVRGAHTLQQRRAARAGRAVRRASNRVRQPLDVFVAPLGGLAAHLAGRAPPKLPVIERY